MECILELKNISYSYPSDYKNIKYALKDVSLKIHKSERIVILGGNGAGKSTLFLCANGVIRADKGDIYLYEREVGTSRRDVNRLRKSVGLVFQDPEDQIIGTSVEADVSFGPLNMGMSRQEALERVKTSLEIMNISEYKDRATHFLSGGEKKTVSIAGIVAMEPDIILFDEPTASLDSEGVKSFEEVVCNLNRKGKTVIIATHDIEFAWRWADRGIVISDGRVTADLPIHEIVCDHELLDASGIARCILADLTQSVYPGMPGEKLPRSVEEFKKILLQTRCL